MKLSNKLFKVSLLAMFSLYSCSIEPVSTQNNIQSNKLIKNYSVSGIVQFENFNKNSFKTKGYEDEVTRKATVSIIYPSDYSNLSLRNTTVATGLTDNNGAFTINPNNFTPSVNDIMILEATKRVNGVGNSISSLRTNIKWNGTSWDGISTPNNYINAKTTSLALISALDPNILTSLDSIGRLNNQNNNVTYDVKLTEGVFNWMLDAVSTVIYEFKDPAQEIFALSLDGRTYTNSFINRTTANMRRLQTTVETYAVDWSGIYPSSAESVEQEAKSKNYWANLKNPFGDYEDISKTLPAVITYDDYQQAKSTLNYKGTVLENKGNLKGIVVYAPIDNGSPSITSYRIYGVDIFGELLKLNTKTASTEYYLSNN